MILDRSLDPKALTRIRELHRAAWRICTVDPEFRIGERRSHLRPDLPDQPLHPVPVGGVSKVTDRKESALIYRCGERPYKRPKMLFTLTGLKCNVFTKIRY
jgi:hypothetical protein